MPLTAHFLNVGRGDCTILEFPSGHVGMVDIDTLHEFDETTTAEKLQRFHQSSRFAFLRATTQIPVPVLDRIFVEEEQEGITDPLSYYAANFGLAKPIFRLLITHPDMDHMAGLQRLRAEIPITNFWHTGLHDFNLGSCTEEEWERGPYDRRDWEAYKALRAGSSPTSLKLHRGAQGQFWTEDGVELWAPTPDLEQLAEEHQAPNILSMIIKVAYAGRSILLGGDATADETWPAIYPFTDMRGITVLKASHHGRKTGYHQSSVSEMSPWLTITSVGSVEHDATESYRQYSEYTVSLRRAGGIRITIGDDGRIWYPQDLQQYWKARR